jgi:hypothetical protein
LIPFSDFVLGPAVINTHTLRQLWHEQKKVSEMQDNELVACVLDSKDKMPLRKPFPHNHKEVANHKKLRAHVGEVAEDLMLATYTNPNVHYQMKNDLAALTWDPKGVGLWPDQGHMGHVHLGV